jgi:hypothetical protein
MLHFVMKYFLLILILSFPVVGSGGDGNIRKKIRLSILPTPVPVWETDQVVVPMRRVGNLLLVEVKIDTLVGNLILDTGAPHLVLNSTYFREYPHFGEILAGGITGSAGSGNQTEVKRLGIGSGLCFKKVEADVIPLGHLESRKGIKILGLLGLNLFSRLQALLDMRNNILTLNRLNKSGELNMIADPMKEALTSAIKIPILVENGILTSFGTIANRRLRFCLDTGAETNILHSGLHNKILGEVMIQGRKRLTGTGRTQTEVLSGILKQIRFGQKEYFEQPVIVTNLDHLSQAYGIEIDGMIGADFFNDHIVQLNLQKEELLIW